MATDELVREIARVKDALAWAEADGSSPGYVASLRIELARLRAKQEQMETETAQENESCCRPPGTPTPTVRRNK